MLSDDSWKMFHTADANYGYHSLHLILSDWLASYGLQGGNAAWFMCWLQHYTNSLSVCLLNFLPHLLSPLLSSFLCFFLTKTKPCLFEPTTCWSQVQCSTHCITVPPMLALQRWYYYHCTSKGKESTLTAAETSSSVPWRQRPSSCQLVSYPSRSQSWAVGPSRSLLSTILPTQQYHSVQLLDTMSQCCCWFLTGSSMSWLQKFPGLFQDLPGPEAIFRDPVVCQWCLNIKTSSSYYGVRGGAPAAGNFLRIYR